MRLDCIRGHHIWVEPLTNRSVVVDAGAHRGEFSAEIIRQFGCQCHLVEANPALAANLAVEGAASITTAALSAHDGRAVLHVTENLEASGLFNAGPVSTGVEVETVSLTTLMQRLGITKIDILKLDIEGAEFELIASTPEDLLRRISQITVEFHDFKSAFRGRGLFENSRKGLQELGFISCNMAFRTHGDVLFLNRTSLPLTALQTFYLRHLGRWTEKVRNLIAS